MLVGLTLALGIALTGPQAQALSFTQGAQTVPVMLRKLSEATGTTHEASATFANLVVVIRAEKTTLPELRARLAAALNGTWVQEPTRLVLTQTPAQARAEQQARITLRLNELQRALEKRRPELDQPLDVEDLRRRAEAIAAITDPSAKWQAEERLRQTGPYGRLLLGLLLATPPEPIAALRPGQRLIVRMQPNARQIGFRRDAAEATINRFLQEQQAWANLKVEVPENDGRMVGDPFANREPTTRTQLGQLQLEIRSMAPGRLAFVNLQRFGRSSSRGRADTLAQLTVAEEALMERFRPRPVEVDGDIPLELSPEDLAFIKAVQNAMERRQDALLPDDIVRRILDPNADPLNILVGPTLLRYAEHKKANLVAWVPDTALPISPMAMGQNNKLAAAVQTLMTMVSLTQTREGDWIQIVPNDPTEARQNAVPRQAFRAFLQAVADGSLTLDQRATYTAAFGEEFGVAEWVAFIVGDTVSDMPGQRNALRLWGALPQNLRNQLRGGEPVRLSVLPPAARALVEQIVYGGAIESMESLGPSSLRLAGEAGEPTDMLPLGLTNEVYLTAKVYANPVVIAMGRVRGRVRPVRALEAHSMGYMVQQIEAGETSNLGIPGFLGFVPGEQRNFGIRVMVGPRSWHELRLTESVPQAGASPGPWTALPEPLRKEVERSIAQRNQRGTEVGRARPPEREK